MSGATHSSAVPGRGSRTKPIVAIVAGASLLLGGGTTLAYWSTQATITGGTVNSGDLDLTLIGTPSWTLTAEGGTPIDVADITTVQIVPGDIVTLSQAVMLTLIGDNLVADLAVSPTTAPAGIQPPVVSVTDADGATFSGTGLTAALDGQSVTVSVAFEFDAETTERSLVTTAFDFEDVTLTLTQQDPTP